MCSLCTLDPAAIVIATHAAWQLCQPYVQCTRTILRAFEPVYHDQMPDLNLHKWATYACAWLNRSRRLSKDYVRHPATSEP